MIESVIRAEHPDDAAAIHNVIFQAFTYAKHRDGDEQYLVERLRKSAAFQPELSLVAIVGNRVVGHILFSEVQIGVDHPSLALAPLSVLPTYQQQGIGSALIRAGHEAALAQGYTSAIVLGDYGYYSRFGYVPASQWHISAPFDVADENFMAIELIPTRLQGVNGVVRYPKEFVMD